MSQHLEAGAAEPTQIHPLAKGAVDKEQAEVTGTWPDSSSLTFAISPSASAEDESIPAAGADQDQPATAKVKGPAVSPSYVVVSSSSSPPEGISTLAALSTTSRPLESGRPSATITAKDFAYPGSGPTLGVPSSQGSHGAPAAGKDCPAPSFYGPSQLFLLYQDVGPEEDDQLHEPDDCEKAPPFRRSFSVRGCVDGLSLLFLAAALSLLLCGYPIISWIFYINQPAPPVGFGLGGTNGTGQRPFFSDLRQLIDPDTPGDARSWTHPRTGERHHLVFSDEFNAQGRTFWPGEDPFWTAVDIWYGVTGDVEWYSPEAVNTTGGYLEISMEEKINHNLWFQSGMLQSWNKFCFQGGYIEISAILPGDANTQGWWPGLWTMGNLGRAGYASTTDGLWPFSYSSCDTGILPNQTFLNGSGPAGAINRRKPFSYLPGMRYSACTCEGQDHPGPNRHTGRGAPEIDLLEAQTAGGVGGASQSLQCAPFDYEWKWDESTAQFEDSSKTVFNPYTGGKYQEAVSAVTNIPDEGYELASEPRAVSYGLHYEPSWDGAGEDKSVTWFLDGEVSWSVTGQAIGPQPAMDISQRLIPVEPMSIIINLGMSDGFQKIHYDTLKFPAKLRIDYVRVYQPDGTPDRISCDPPDHPTADYIASHPDLYRNPNLTIWPTDLYGPWPRNELTGC